MTSLQEQDNAEGMEIDSQGIGESHFSHDGSGAAAKLQLECHCHPGAYLYTPFRRFSRTHCERNAWSCPPSLMDPGPDNRAGTMLNDSTRINLEASRNAQPRLARVTQAKDSGMRSEGAGSNGLGTLERLHCEDALSPFGVLIVKNVATKKRGIDGIDTSKSL